MGWTAIAWLGVGAVIGGVVQKLREPVAKAATSVQPITAVSASVAAPTSVPQWQLAYHLAADMAQLKGGFLARTSHELRSPLNSVISLHQLILSDLCDSPEEEREFVAQSYEAAQKLLKLMDQLTDLSKLEHGGASLAITDIDLNMLLLEVEQVVQIQAQNRNLRLEIAHPDEDIEVRGDRQRLLQVILHLLMAPIALMDSGYIWLTPQVQGDMVVLRVADQRPTEAWAEPRELLTQSPADESDASPTPPPSATAPSTGLTLMLCQRLMALMGGELRLVEPDPQPSDAPQASPQLECRLPHSS